MISVDVLIVGGGPAGLLCGRECAARGLKYLILEPNWVGGLYSSWDWKGHTLDFGPHIFLYPNEKAKEWFLSFCPDAIEKERKDYVLLDGELHPYPIQKSKAEWVTCDFQGEPTNYAEYCLKHFGKQLTDKFFRPYNEKLFQCKLEELDHEVLGGRSPSPDAKPQMFLYPKTGGMRSFVEKLAEGLVIRKDKIEWLWGHRVGLASGEEVVYREKIECCPQRQFTSIVVWVGYSTGYAVDDMLAVYLPGQEVGHRQSSVRYLGGPLVTVREGTGLGVMSEGMRALEYGYPVPLLRERTLPRSKWAVGRAGRHRHQNLWAIKEDAEETVAEIAGVL